MPYVGQSITDFFSEIPQQITRDTARKMCDRGGDIMEHIAVINTPVETGRLRNAWKRRAAEEVAGAEGSGWSTDVYNDTDYAEYVENGTGLWGPKHAKYLIKPKKPGGSLRWVGKDGTVHFAKFVWHPGSPGNYMLAIALNVTDTSPQSVWDDLSEEWKALIEGQAHR